MPITIYSCNSLRRYFPPSRTITLALTTKPFILSIEATKLLPTYFICYKTRYKASKYPKKKKPYKTNTSKPLVALIPTNLATTNYYIYLDNKEVNSYYLEYNNNLELK